MFAWLMNRTLTENYILLEQIHFRAIIENNMFPNSVIVRGLHSVNDAMYTQGFSLIRIPQPYVIQPRHRIIFLDKFSDFCLADLCTGCIRVCSIIMTAVSDTLLFAMSREVLSARS